MTVGTRLREERHRLSLSQGRLAELLGVAKNTAINWEKDASSPTAAALIAFADAGADIIYILTGRRFDLRSSEASDMDERIAGIRRDMLSPRLSYYEIEDEAPLMAARKADLQIIVQGKKGNLTDDQRKDAEALLDIVSSPASLAEFRAADRVQHHTRRLRIRQRLSSDYALGDFHPTEATIDTMTTLAVDHGAPLDLLMRLFYEIVVAENELKDDVDGDGD